MRIIARLYFALIGWKTYNGIPPQVRKYVMIGAPHTSNWDFPITMAALLLMRVKVNYLAKKELFKFPLGIIMRAFGGIPVDRSKKNTRMVDNMISEFGLHDRLILLVPPEGTRGFVKEWKSGFYYVALGAGVPIGLGFLDYKKKEAGIAKLFYPTGNYEKDLEEIKHFYRGIAAKHPEKSSVR
jgi:1-acyl-sn-glycerol-3-phosphate acyltransferase